MKRLTVSLSLIVAISIIGLFLFYQPHLTMYRIIVAAKSGDDLALQEVVDFPAVRAHLKASFTQHVVQQTLASDNAGNPFAALGVLFAQKLTDTMVDAMVTPAMLSQVLRNAVTVEGQEAPADWQVLMRILTRLPGRYVNASTYVLETKSVKDQSPIRFVLQRSFISFRVTRIEIDFPTLALPARSEAASKLASPKLGHLAPEAKPQAPPTWEPFEHRSPMDDSIQQGVRRQADQELPARFGSFRPVLILRCSRENALEIYVIATRMLDYNYETGGVRVRLRYDQNPPISAIWSASKDHEAVFSPTPRETISRLLESKQFLIEFTPVSESPQIATFTLSDLAEHFPLANTDCGRKKVLEPRPIAQKAPDDKRETRVNANGPPENPNGTDPLPRDTKKVVIDDFLASIQVRIKSRVVVPLNMDGNPEVRFEVILLPGGEVLSATLRKSSGNPAYDAAVERAIMAAQPLPVPEDSDLFQSYFRQLQMAFKPRD